MLKLLGEVLAFTSAGVIGCPLIVHAGWKLNPQVNHACGIKEYDRSAADKVCLRFCVLYFCVFKSKFIIWRLFFKGAVSRIFSVTMDSQKAYLFRWNRQNNGRVLLTITLLVHTNNFSLFLAGDGQDGSGLQLDKIGQYLVFEFGELFLVAIFVQNHKKIDWKKLIFLQCKFQIISLENLSRQKPVRVFLWE